MWSVRVGPAPARAHAQPSEIAVNDPRSSMFHGSWSVCSLRVTSRNRTRRNYRIMPWKCTEQCTPYCTPYTYSVHVRLVRPLLLFLSCPPLPFISSTPPLSCVNRRTRKSKRRSTSPNGRLPLDVPARLCQRSINFPTKVIIDPI